MASQTAEGSSSAAQKTNAELLREKHEAIEAHNPTVEDEVDEEDIQHPPPSSLISPVANSSGFSEEAAGKQRADAAPKKAPVLDTKSEDLFPSLGGGPKARAAPASAPAWGVNKNTQPLRPAANGFSNGPTSAPLASSPLSSRASTPLSGILTPASSNAMNNAQSSRKGPMQMAMPGKHTDSITLVPTQMDKSKPIQPYLDRLNKKSRATVTRHIARDGSSIVFEGSGPKKDVSEALRTIARELCAKQKLRVPVPASCRAHIIGQGGAVIKDISARTGAKIQVPKSEVPSTIQDDDDSVTIDVEIEGDPYAVELARLDIDKIVSARTSRVNMRLRDIPPEFFPFLAGPHNSRTNAMQQDKDVQIQVPHFHTWQHRPPPRVSKPQERPDFQPHPNLHVQISGERKAAQEARAQIERLVEQLRKQLTVEDHSFQRGHHQFIIGERGMSLHDFLEETGCAVVLPPDHDDTEDITIIGPTEQLQDGVDRAATLAAEMQMANVDPRRYFADAPFGSDAHSRALSRYLQERQLEAEIDSLYGAQLAFPPSQDPSVNWEIYSRDMKKSIQARSDLTKIIQAHPPAKLALVEVDPFFHPHLQEHCLQTLRNGYGVNMIVPRDGESDHIVLVYEGPEGTRSPFQIPRQRPSEPEITAFKEAIRQARSELLSVIGDRPKVATRQVEVPRKFHDKLRKHVDREQKQTPQTFPVQVLIGEPQEAFRKLTSKSDLLPSENAAVLRGLDPDVADLEANILAFLEGAERDELERGYTTTFDFPAKFNGYLIGREGAKINEIRDHFDVDIKMLDDGKIEIKGPKAKADACKDHIIGLRKKYEDEATYILKIDPRFHGQLVGKKGADVNRLQDKYNVKIQFPQSPNTHDDQSNADTASDTGPRRPARTNQAQDEVVIRGPRQGADKARTEILDLYQYARDNSHSATIPVARQHLGSLIGQRGSEIERLRLETGAQIDFPDRQETADPKARAEIVIKGTKQAVDAARAEIQKKVKLLDDTVNRSLDVDRKYHGSLIGAQGANIRRMVVDAGGPEQSHQIVKFPERGSESSTIRVEGPQSVVVQVVAAIERFVLDQENQTTDTVDVPPEKHGQLIGQRGEAKRKLEQQFNVSMEIPKKGSDRSSITITGAQEDVAKAKEYLAALADQNKEGETINMPKHLHHAISANGRLFWRLKNDHDVTIDHGGMKPPTKQQASAPRPRTNGAAAPLITDEDSAGAHSWVLSPAEGMEGGDGSTIPWIISGPSAEKVAAAKERVQRALDAASKPSATGYLTLADPRYYRFVIGPGGRNINSIREQTGCTIQVPNAKSGKGGDGEAIEIVGSAEGCEEAKELVLDFVRNGAARG